MRKSIIFILLALSIQAENRILKYNLGCKYQFDSNIGQNINNQSGNYVIPSLGIAYYPFRKTDLFVQLNLKFDSYITERDIDDNSPFLSGKAGIKLGKKKLSYSPKIQLDQYIGMNSFNLQADIIEENSKSWQPFLRKYFFKNSIEFNKKRNNLTGKLNIGYQNYGDLQRDTEIIKNEEDGFLYQVEIGYKRKIKNIKKNIRIKNSGIIINYDGLLARTDKECFNRLSGSVNTKIKFWKTNLDLQFSIIQKTYTSKIKHPFSGDTINASIKTLHIEPTYEIPIVSDLSLKTGAKLRFRRASIPEDEYNRHTVFALLSWNSSLKRKNNEK